MMKRERGKGFLQGVICMLVLTLLVGTVSATSGAKSIQAIYKDIKISIDGKTINPKDANGNAVEPFTYNGTTYVPARAIGEALGKTVTWDGSTNTVYMGAAKSNTGTNAYSRTNPAPIGTEQTIETDNYTVSVKVNSISRGTQAWSKILAANQFNSKPDSGTEYILANITISAIKTSSDKALSVYGYSDFDIFSSSYAEYEKKSVVDPDPQLKGDVYGGSSITGYLAIEVSQSDNKPCVAYARGYDGSGGLWFALYN